MYLQIKPLWHYEAMEFEEDYKNEDEDWIWLVPSRDEHTLMQRASKRRIIEAGTGGPILRIEAFQFLLNYTHLPSHLPGVAIQATFDNATVLADVLEGATRDFSADEMIIAHHAVVDIRNYMQFE